MERYLILAAHIVAGCIGALVICFGGQAYDNWNQRRRGKS